MSPDPSAISAVTGASTAARTGAGSYANIVRTIASTTCGRTARTTCPAAVSTTPSLAARSWSASHVDGSNAAPVAEPRVHRAQDLGRLVEATQELVHVEVGRGLQPLPAAVDEHEAGAPGTQANGRHRGDDRPEPVARDHDRPVRRQPGSLGHGDRVGRERLGVVARPSARRRAPGRAGRRRPWRSPSRAAARRAPTTTRAGGARAAAGRRAGARRDPGRGSAPVVEVEPDVAVGEDDEPVGLGIGIGCRRDARVGGPRDDPVHAIGRRLGRGGHRG